MIVRVVDTETTGLDPGRDRVVELGWCDVTVSNGKVERGPARATLVNPGIPIPAEASAVHHITDTDIADAGTLADAIGLMMAAPEIATFAAHNARFDRGFLPDLCDKAPWIDTERIAKHLWPEAPAFGNQTLRYWLRPRIETTGLPHRAASDAEVSAGILVTALLHPRIIGRLDRLELLTARPALLARMPLGKHRGQPFHTVPRGWLTWADGKFDDDLDLAHSIRWALGGRYSPACDHMEVS